MGNPGTPDSAASTPSSGGFRLSREPVVPERRTPQPPAAPIAQPPPLEEGLGSLPQGYGTRSLYLVARDPHWLFCYWDVDWAEYAAHRAAGGKVHLRLFSPVGEEVHREEVSPDACNWFIPVARGNSVFYGEIGICTAEGHWEVIARSPHAATPPDGAAPEVGELFATVPYHLAFQKLLDLVKCAMTEGESLMDALARIQNEGRRLIDTLEATPAWDDGQRRLLATLLGHDVEALMQLSGPEVDRVLRGQLSAMLAGEKAPGVEAPLFAPQEGLSSWLSQGPLEAGGSSWSGSSQEWGSSWSGLPPGAGRGFFLNVNAEVIFYGGTEPGARLWIDGQPVPVDARGQFRYHFHFNDGGREIPIVAEAPDGRERRSATLRFERETSTSPGVEAARVQHGEPLAGATFGRA